MRLNVVCSLIVGAKLFQPAFTAVIGDEKDAHVDAKKDIDVDVDAAEKVDLKYGDTAAAAEDHHELKIAHKTVDLQKKIAHKVVEEGAKTASDSELLEQQEVLEQQGEHKTAPPVFVGGETTPCGQDCGGEAIRQIREVAEKAQKNENAIATLSMPCHEDPKDGPEGGGTLNLDLSLDDLMDDPSIGGGKEPEACGAALDCGGEPKKSEAAVKAKCDGKKAQLLQAEANRAVTEATRHIKITKIKKKRAMLAKARAVNSFKAASEEANAIVKAKVASATVADTQPTLFVQTHDLVAAAKAKLETAKKAKVRADNMDACQQNREATLKVTACAVTRAKCQADSDAKQATESVVKLSNEAQELLNSLKPCEEECTPAEV